MDPFLTRSTVAAALAVSKKKVRVTVPRGTTEPVKGIIYPTLLAAYASLLSSCSSQPVKLTLSGTQFLAPRRYPCRIRHKTGLDRNGNLTAMDVEIRLDLGAYPLLADTIFQRSAFAACGGYSCPNLRVRLFLAASAKAPAGAFPGLGEPQATFATERHMARVTEALHEDPLSWKGRNLGSPLPMRGRSNARPVMEDAVRRSDFRRKHGAYEASKSSTDNWGLTPLRGIGLSICFHSLGLPEESSCRIKMSFSTNRKLRLFTSVGSLSNGPFFASIAAQILSIPESDVLLEETDSTLVPDSGPALCSRSVLVIGKMVEQGCRSLQRRRLMETPPIDILKSRRGANRRCAGRPHAGLRNAGIPVAGVSAAGAPAACWEATVVEVEVDPVDLIPRCLGIWITLDAGRIVVPEIAEDKVRAAALRNLASACIRISERESGAVYPVFAAGGVPPLHIAFFEGKDPQGPMGAKGMGDQAVTGVAAAYATAVSQATGLNLTAIPVIPAVIEEELSR
jgi:CO/xanthine dehydrogenase Mo-binding subunit